MDRHVLSILVGKESLILNRIVGLFSKRCFSIDSLTFGEAEDKSLLRINIELKSDKHAFIQIKKQLEKLIDVIDISEPNPANCFIRELVLIKVRSASDNRLSILEAVEAFQGKIIEINNNSLTIEIAGNHEKINPFITAMSSYGIESLSRTGFTALDRCKI